MASGHVVLDEGTLAEPDQYPPFAGPVVTACVVAGVGIPVATWILRIRHRPRTAALPRV
ncbi:hypothetical protein GCM10023113_20290 [Cellulomonas oligotrophica]|uniref:Uncharacterized protein n=1 Tax=Cellulomonas oligotrophica TaxID=931536 RepID=A0ABQ4DFH3_9CELL|nr:hypothetical protein Col01nite_36480 [Cellulomonas oligotrophica]